MSNKPRLSILIFMLLNSGAYAAGDNPYFKGDTGLNFNDFIVNKEWMGSETVDPYSGNLFVLNTDVSLSSNNGLLDIVVNRFYDVANYASGQASFRKDSYEWNLSNGWVMRVAPRLTFFNYYNVDTQDGTPYWFHDRFNSGFTSLCKKDRFLWNRTGDKLVLAHADGRTELFAKEATSNMARTSSNWQVSCIAGNIVLNSPEGVRYDYGNIDTDLNTGFHASTVYYAEFLGPDLPTEHSVYMDAKKATDPLGNVLEFEYKQFGTKVKPEIDRYGHSSTEKRTQYYNLGNPNLQLVSVKANDGRAINLEYDPVNGFLKSIKDNNNRVWKYNYTSGIEAVNFNDTRGNTNLVKNVTKDNYFLTSVTFPDNNKITYDYHPIYWTDRVKVIQPDLSPLTHWASFADGEKLINALKLKSIVYPTQGKVSYEYSYKILESSFDPFGEKVMPYVKTRSLSSGDKWTYDYQRGATGQYAQTVIKGPEGTTTYKFIDPEFNSWRGIGEPPYYGAPVQNTLWKLGKPVEIIDPTGGVTTFQWTNRLLSQQPLVFVDTGFVADEKTWAADLSKKTITRDGAIYTTEYQNYDSYGNPGKVIETGPNGENRTTIYTYYNDPDKWILSKPKNETTYNGSTLVGSITRNYDSNGNVLSENKDGIVNINTYDAQGNIATSVNANGATTTFSNYKRGIAQTEVQPEGVTITREVDNAGNVISETNGAGQKTSYTYDGLDRVTSIIPPVGDKTTITYTATSKTTTRGNLVEVMNYDEFGRPKDSSKDGIKTIYKYDAFDNKIFESNPSSDKGTTISYDALNRVKTITNPDNTKQTYEYGKASTSITDERGKKTTYNYRSYGNPEEQHLMSITAPVADANVTLTRNGRDQVTTVKQKELTRTYGYNSKYQLTSIDNPETGKTIYGRDNVGNMTSVKVGSLGTTTLTYDGRNRNTSITYPSGTPKVTKTYTKTDKLDMVDNTTVQRKFNYDANDNLSSETLAVDKQTFTTKYGYNTKDQLSSVTYPQSGTVIDYAPDALGRPTKVGNYVTNISYWPSGQFKQLNYANGTVSNYGQNDRLWPSSFDTKKGTVAHLNSNYTYDGVGNLLSIADSTDSNFNRTATYDDINRLITAQGPWGAGTLTYDGMGNITKQKFGSQVLDYVYNSTTNKLSSTSGSKLGTYSYDVMGNITSDGVNTYSYDAVPSLICAKCNDSSKRVDYNYDGLNKRVSVTKAGVKRYEILATNGDQLIEFIPSQNNKLTEYFYLGGKRIAQRISP